MISRIHFIEEAEVTGWPSVGKISFSKVSLKYNLEAEPSIHDVSFNIKPTEKV